MNKVLFIDDDLSLLRSIKRTAKVGKLPFEVLTLNTPQDAFSKVIEEDISLIIADTSLQGVDSKIFFGELNDFNPSIIRTTLNSDINILESFNDNGQTHSNIYKPCDSKSILEWVKVLFKYKNDYCEDLFIFFFEDVKLKSYPEHLNKITKLLKNEDFQIDELCDLIKDDINLASQIIGSVNSSSFGFSRKIVKLKEAIEYLGTSNIINFIKYMNMFSIFENFDNKQFYDKILIDHLYKEKVFDRNILMDMTFTLNFIHFFNHYDFLISDESRNATLAVIMHLLMIDKEICDTVFYATKPEECTYDNKYLNYLSLCRYVKSKSFEDFVFKKFTPKTSKNIRERFYQDENPVC